MEAFLQKHQLQTRLKLFKTKEARYLQDLFKRNINWTSTSVLYSCKSRLAPISWPSKYTFYKQKKQPIIDACKWRRRTIYAIKSCQRITFFFLKRPNWPHTPGYKLPEMSTTCHFDMNDLVKEEKKLDGEMFFEITSVFSIDTPFPKSNAL